MNPFLLGLLGTEVLRPAWREATSGYLQSPHPMTDPYVLPALNAIYKADKAVMGPYDYAKGAMLKAVAPLDYNSVKNARYIEPKDILSGLVQRRVRGKAKRGGSSGSF